MILHRKPYVPMKAPIDPRTSQTWEKLSLKVKAVRLKIYESYRKRYILHEAKHDATLRRLKQRHQETKADPLYYEDWRQRVRRAEQRRKAQR